MEVIPKTHMNLFIHPSDILKYYSERLQIEIYPNDLLLLYLTDCIRCSTY